MEEIKDNFDGKWISDHKGNIKEVVHLT